MGGDASGHSTYYMRSRGREDEGQENGPRMPLCKGSALVVPCPSTQDSGENRGLRLTNRKPANRETCTPALACIPALYCIPSSQQQPPKAPRRSPINKQETRNKPRIFAVS
jgi:hypothetical protein